ncbi:hypothetical protein QX233_22410, partial [Chryseobacterium gambrini]
TRANQNLFFGYGLYPRSDSGNFLTDYVSIFLMLQALMSEKPSDLDIFDLGNVKYERLANSTAI